MAEELHAASRPDSKRKLDDQPAAPRRASGFSSPPPPLDGQGATPPSYSSVPPPPDGFQLAKQRAQEIAAKLFSEAEAKRPRVENGGGGNDSGERSLGYGSNDYFQKPVSQSIPTHAGSFAPGSFSAHGYNVSSKKIDIPNGRVGVIIGKGGETIKRLQNDSGAKIQVTRDLDANPHSQTRPVELTGTSDQISKAEELIASVLAEAEAGSSGLNATRDSQIGSEHFSMRVPNNKVGLIIGKGGEMIKSMQMKSGARIQLIPLHLPPGDTSTERTVHIDGTTECIELAKQLVNEIISDNRVRNPSMSGGYSQQGYAPRPPMSWGPQGQPPAQQPGYGYMQPGAYPGQPTQYATSQPQYSSYQQPPPAGGYSTGWDQSPSAPTQQTTPGSGFDYYNQQQTQQQSTDAGSYYGQPPSYGRDQGSYVDSTYPQPTGQQQSYDQDAYTGGYHAAAAPQSAYSQNASNPQAAYQQGYGTCPAYGANQDGESQNYRVQSSAQSGHGTSQQNAPHSGYGSQHGQIGAASQPHYGQSPQGQKQASVPQAYGQGQQSQGTQSAYAQGPSSFGSSGGSQPGYGQPPPYGQTQPAYGQLPQQAYTENYGGSGGYAEPPQFAGDNASRGGYDAPAAPSAPGGATRTSPRN